MKKTIYTLFAVSGILISNTLMAANNLSNLQNFAAPVTTTTPTPPTAVQNLNLRNLRILKTIDLTKVNNVPNIQLGAASLDLNKLAGPQSDFAKRLKSLQNLPGLVNVKTVKNEVHEVDNGVLINNLIQYQLKPNSCRPAKKQKQSKGLLLVPRKIKSLHCGEKRNPQTTISALANSRSPLYIANRQERQQAVDYLRQTEQAVNQDLSEMRTFLNTADAVNLLGQSEVERLQSLQDEDLATELFDSADTVIEEAFFIPRLDQFNNFSSIRLLQPRPMINTQALRNLQITGPLEQPVVARNIRLAPETFLAGFTLGRNYEWRKRISKTINTCLVGCARTYYVEPYAKLGYGLGLRFPIRSNLQYSYAGRGDSASLSARFVPFDGSVDDYKAAGLENGKLFNGKEIVAEYTAKAGIKYKLPGVGRRTVEYGDHKDLTRSLPEPFKNGHYTPPAPGQRGLLTFEKVFNEPQFDLLLGQGNFGITGARLYPAVNVRLTSDQLSFKLTDAEANNRSQRLNSNGTTSVAVNSQSGESRFSIGDPTYNLSFKVEPGINYRFFIDLALWGKTWSDTLWIPQLTITLPPNGIDFTCHAGTRCNKSYRIQTSTGNVTSSSRNASQTGNSQPQACSKKTSYGLWAIKDSRSGQFVRGGVTGQGRNDLVGALGGTALPRQKRAWETFYLYNTQNGKKYGRWIVNSIDGRYLETVNNTNTLLLNKGRRCTTAIDDMQWEVIPAGKSGTETLYLMKNRRNGKYVRTVSGGLLKANANRQSAGKYAFIKVGN